MKRWASKGSARDRSLATPSSVVELPPRLKMVPPKRPSGPGKRAGLGSLPPSRTRVLSTGARLSVLSPDLTSAMRRRGGRTGSKRRTWRAKPNLPTRYSVLAVDRTQRVRLGSAPHYTDSR